MRISNEQRQKFKDLLIDLDNCQGSILFLAEYLAEKIATESSDILRQRNEYRSLFNEELISQLNERI